MLLLQIFEKFYNLGDQSFKTNCKLADLAQLRKKVSTHTHSSRVRFAGAVKPLYSRHPLWQTTPYSGHLSRSLGGGGGGGG